MLKEQERAQEEVDKQRLNKLQLLREERVNLIEKLQYISLLLIEAALVIE